MSNARELIDRIVPGATVAPAEPRKIKLSLLRDLRRLGMSDVDQHLGEIVSAIPAGRVTTYGALADCWHVRPLRRTLPWTART